MIYVIVLLLIGIWLNLSVIHDDLGTIEHLLRVAILERRSDGGESSER